MERITLFADVLLPLPLPGYYTYRIPYELNDRICQGQRVVVQFGKKKLYTALVRKVHEIPPKFSDIKYVLSNLDETPVVNETQFAFWEWLANYYMCSPGEVMNAAIPAALKLASESKIVLNPDFDGDISVLGKCELLITEALHAQEVISVKDAERICDTKSIIPVIKNLIDNRVVLLEEELRQRYKPKTEVFVRLTEKGRDEKVLQKVFDVLEKRAPKQLKLLMQLISRSSKAREHHILRSDLLKDPEISSSQLQSLIKKELCELYEMEMSRLETVDEKVMSEVVLSEAQSEAFNEVDILMNEKRIVLLQGVTSSGKTEIYIKLIQQVIDKGKQVLYLLPEIALTTQIINRLRKAFGDRVGVYHSKFNEQERVEIWNKVLPEGKELGKKPYDIILGARSAVFMPFNNLGLIIIDEEHDASYKQYDPAPRYHARDSAIYLAKLHNADVLLGSATPSLESIHNTRLGKYGYVFLSERYGGVMMPEIFVADINKERKSRSMKSIFTSMMLENIGEALNNKEQVILFQNRRGFSVRLECEICHHVPQCRHCDVTLTYHKFSNKLSCHYCGYAISVPERCPACHNPKILMQGFGTEKIEEELAVFFPQAKISRMDLDTTRTKYGHQKIINDFEDKKIDILVGTQMVTKGLDFENVSVVGIMNADSMISFPDFRAFERSFQLMAQVSGRSGRKKKRGKVIIQTTNPDHAVIRYVVDNDYEAMVSSQLTERTTYKYPPYYKLVSITLKDKDVQKLKKASLELASYLRKDLGQRVLGPEAPLVSKVRNEYLQNILIKIEKELSLSKVKDQVRKRIELFRTDKAFSSCRIVIDVDPV